MRSTAPFAVSAALAEAGHGMNAGAAYTVRTYTEGSVPFDAIRHAGWDGVLPIKLLSCNTALPSTDKWCQALANNLGVSIFAADTLVWYIPTGHVWYYYVWPFLDADDPSYVTSGSVMPYHRSSIDASQPDFTRPGKFIEFKPE